MSRLTDLIARVRVKDTALAEELAKEYKALSNRKAFGLNFERHRPENVELAGRSIRKGDKVRVLLPRGSTKKGDQSLWRVIRIIKTKDSRVAQLSKLYVDEVELKEAVLDDLVVVAEFMDYIYPGLVSTEKISRGGDKPYHTVINGENFHVLEALTYTHQGKIDAIYIDPPYNSGAKDWKYNNDYVEKEDLYRHSKWLSFMERRLSVAKNLLNPANSVLIVSIDEKEVHRLRLLLEQIFPEATVQMITTVISQNGTSREGEFSRVEEYLLIARFGKSKIFRTNDNMLSNDSEGKVSRVWFNFMRTSTFREKSEGQFYPIFINPKTGKILEIGEPVGKGNEQPEYKDTPDRVAVWPIRDDGKFASWGAIPKTANDALLKKGFLRLGKINPKTGYWSVQYVREGDRKRIDSGQIEIVGHRKDGSVELQHVDVNQRENFPKTVWNRKSHDATAHGTRLNKILIPGRDFPYPKSLYAVEDTLRFFLKENPKAIVLDFFSGSGTTCHAVMRLNSEDSGRRQVISVTNNEVSADEQKALRKNNLRPGDEEWEKLGICDYITKPRIKAAITGKTAENTPILEDYKFGKQSPIADGFEENAEFFTLSYETPIAVSHNIAFKRIAPLLWMRAGSQGKRIDNIPAKGWEIVETYGVIVDLDDSISFCKAVKVNKDIRFAFIITNDDRRFQAVTRHLPESVEPIRLYESYLSNFRFSMDR